MLLFCTMLKTNLSLALCYSAGVSLDFMKNHSCCSYSVFSQIVSYHILLPHFLWSLRCFRKPCFLLTISLLFQKPMYTLILLRVTTPFLRHNKKKKTASHSDSDNTPPEHNSMQVHKQGHLALAHLHRWGFGP